MANIGKVGLFILACIFLPGGIPIFLIALIAWARRKKVSTPKVTEYAK